MFDRSACAAFIAIILAATGGCEPERVEPQPVNAGYFQLRACSSSPGANTEALVDPQGTTWHCERTAAVDMSGILFREVGAVHAGIGDALFVPTKPQTALMLLRWSREHMGDHLGVLVNCRLIWTDQIRGQLSQALLIPAGAFEGRLGEVEQAIIAGGKPCTNAPTTSAAAR